MISGAVTHVSSRRLGGVTRQTRVENSRRTRAVWRSGCIRRHPHGHEPWRLITQALVDGGTAGTIGGRFVHHLFARQRDHTLIDLPRPVWPSWRVRLPRIYSPSASKSRSQQHKSPPSELESARTGEDNGSFLPSPEDFSLLSPRLGQSSTLRIELWTSIAFAEPRRRARCDR